MSRSIFVLLAAALGLAAAPASAQSLPIKPSAHTTLGDFCMMPKNLLLADPYAPVSVNCLTAAEVNKAKTALRASATPVKCAVSDAVLAKDPFSPQAVSCRTDTQIQKLITILKKPVSTTDDSCMGPRSLYANDIYGPMAVRCLTQQTISTAATLKKSITQDTLAVMALQGKIGRSQAQLTTILGK